MSKRKILFIGTGFHTIPPVKGAAVETWIEEVAKRLKKYEPYIISPSHPSLPIEEKKDGVSYHRIHIGKLYTRLFKKITRLDPYSYEKRIIKIIKDISPDIIHSHNNYNIFNYNIEEIKTILHMHNGTPERLNKKIDAFIGCSRFTLDRCREVIKGRYHLEKVIYNGVDIDRFMPYWERPDDRIKMRKRFNIGKDDIVILSVCRISPEKGLEYLIEAFSLLLKESSNIKLVIVGEIRKGDRKDCEREQYGIKILDRAKKLKDKIIFTDMVPPQEIKDYYLLGDIFVLPSKSENFPFVILEAMATGLPVIATDVGGVSEALNNLGILIEDYKDIDSLHRNMLSLVCDKKIREMMGKRGRQHIEEHFNWGAITKEVEGLYDSLI